MAKILKHADGRVVQSGDEVQSRLYKQKATVDGWETSGVKGQVDRVFVTYYNGQKPVGYLPGVFGLHWEEESNGQD